VSAEFRASQRESKSRGGLRFRNPISPIDAYDALDGASQNNPISIKVNKIARNLLRNADIIGL